jgi:MFS superfamily sulfate permease-like transporter
MLEIMKSSKTNIVIYFVTAITTISIDLIWGIGIGIALYLLTSQLSRANSKKN